jgi:hypothetical protein
MQKENAIRLKLGRKSLDLLLDLLVALSLGELALAELLALGFPLILGLLGTLRLDLLERVLADLLVGLLVKLLKTVGLNLLIDVARELGLVTLLIIIGEGLHVFSDVAGEDVLAEGLGIELLGLDVVTGETLLGVGNVEATVGGTLHGTKDAGTSGSADKTDVEVALEWAALLTVNLSGLSLGELAIGLFNTSEGLVEAKLDESATGDKKTYAVGGSPVGKTVGNIVGLELVGVGGDEDLVASDLGGDDLGDDVAVGEADHQAVLGRIVLVLGLGDETLAGVVVGLTRASAGVLHLEAAEEMLACAA